MRIRTATPSDRDSVQSLYHAAFPPEEWEAVAGLAVSLLSEDSDPETFALLAEVDGKMSGHIAFSPVSDRSVDNFQGYILAPLAVHPQFQKRGAGTRLIEAGIQRLTELGVDIAFVYGDPQFYGKFGFEADLASQYEAPYPLQFPFGWQARMIREGAEIPASARLTCVSSLSVPELW